MDIYLGFIVIELGIIAISLFRIGDILTKDDEE